MQIFYHIGKYFLLLFSVFKKPEKRNVFWKQVIQEIDDMGVKSIGIVSIISVFMGAVLTIQMAFNIDMPWIPLYTIGFAARQSAILEFSPTIISLILCGKVGSRIASELGTMRVTEQIDALEIMGINPASFLILPKITAATLIFPVLVIISMFLSILGGWVVGLTTNLLTPSDYVYGIQFAFRGYDVVYALTKTVVFAFLITTTSSYYGYFVKGGAIEVGTSSTKAVVYSSINVILFNLILTQLLLT